MTDMPDRFDKRIGHVERDVAEMRGRLSGVEDKLDDVSAGVKQLLNRDATREASMPMPVKDAVQMAMHACVLVGLAVSAIIYVAGGYYSADIALLKYRVGQLGAQAPAAWSTQTTKGR